MDFIPPEIVDKLLAVPVLFGVLVVLVVHWDTTRKMLKIIDKALNGKKE